MPSISNSGLVQIPNITSVRVVDMERHRGLSFPAMWRKEICVSEDV